jgi:endo-1,4-beta-xylanase
LRGLAAGRGLDVGVAVSGAWLQNDPDYARQVAAQFSSLTPETDMQFEVIHPEPGRYDFSRADAVIAFARANGQVVRGHTLVWDLQLPDWVTQGQFSREEWRQILKDHIQTVVGRYRGQVISWDVVNEPLDDEGQIRTGFWLNAIGPEYIALAFQWAHEADPQALLFLNEHAAEGMGQKAQGLYALAQGLLAAGVPLDGIGIEMHVVLGGPLTGADLAANMQRLADLGLIVHITEMDVRTQYSQASRAEKLAGQAELYREFLGACLAAPNCKSFTVWGLTDRHSWIPGYTGRPDMPLLFDELGQPKPAYEAVVETLGGLND